MEDTQDQRTSQVHEQGEEAPPEEATCGDVAAEGDPEVAAQEEQAETELAGEELAEADAVGDEEPSMEAAPPMNANQFLRPGGGFAGSRAPIEQAIRVARRNGLTVTSHKRTNAKPGSDHNVNQKRSYAADLSNAGSPTLEMDRTARQIAAVLGHPEFRAGFLNVTRGGVRLQLIWRAEGHFNHVHVGARRLQRPLRLRTGYRATFLSLRSPPHARSAARASTTISAFCRPFWFPLRGNTSETTSPV
jgi:hypothetical protein